MPFSPVPVWSSSYKAKWESVFAQAGTDTSMDYVGETEKAWQDWFDSNVLAATTAAPITGSPLITATKSKTTFAPVRFANPGTPTLSATVLSNAFAAYATALVWVPPTPAPPFSVIISVVTTPGLIATAQATLKAGLITEFGIIPAAGGEQAKYDAIANLFYTAISSLTVDFIGMDMGAPPKPLLLPSPLI